MHQPKLPSFTLPRDLSMKNLNSRRTAYKQIQDHELREKPYTYASFQQKETTKKEILRIWGMRVCRLYQRVGRGGG